MQILFGILFVLLVLGTSNAQIYTMQVLASPSKCSGGEPCITQPQVAVRKNGEIDLAFTGSVYALMANSPSGVEPLWMGTCDYSNNCGTKVSGSVAIFSFFNGIATFSNLMIKTAGTGYRLKFTLKNGAGQDIAYTFSGMFDVALGPTYKMFLSQQVGSATGGNPFTPNPKVIITDRGSNPLPVNTDTVLVTIYKTPKAGTILRPSTAKTVNIIDGLAAFSQLFINEAGGPYQLRFECSIKVNNQFLPYIYSNEFYIAVGLPALLTFTSGTKISTTPIYAGEYFQTVPRIQIKDAGGNIVTEDSTSAIRAWISDNPSKATLGDPGSLFPQAVSGIVTFSTFTLDKIGRDFRLAFTLSTFSLLTNSFSETDIILYSDKFDCNIGPPRSISTLVAADLAWAGGLPIEIQPVVQLLDNGGNVLSNEYTATVVAQMIPSLASTRVIKIDSSSQDLTFVRSVTSSLSPAYYETYGAGSVIDIALNFNYEVWLTVTGPSSLPTIELTSTDSGATRRLATLDPTQDITRVKSLVFNYVVSAGDLLAANNNLDIYSPGANQMGLINLQGGSLVNGNNKAASLVIPTDNDKSLDTAKIIIDTTPPAALLMNTTTADGEYGVGEVIEFLIVFDKPVVAVGTPYLELSATNLAGSQIRAYFNRSGSTFPDIDNILVFTYPVVPGDAEAVDLTLNNNNILYPDANSYIRRKASTLITDINVFLTDDASGNTILSTFATDYAITIDTTVPVLDIAYGVQTEAPHITSTKYPGDQFPVFLKFTKPVVVLDPGTTLTFNVGLFNYAAVFKEVLPDEKTLEFTFTVAVASNIADLDIVSGSYALLSTAQANFIRRKATIPLQNVNADTSAIFNSNSVSLKDQAQIYIKGWNAAIQSVTLQSTSVPSPLEPDDFALIDVTFDLPVTMSCNPVLILMLPGSNSKVSKREVPYLSGNGGNVITFKYTVQFGDEASGLQYRYSPGAFCYKSGCVRDSCTIITTSANMVGGANALVAMPVVNIATLSPAGGVYIDNTVNVVPVMSAPRTTTIVGITSRLSTATGSFGNYASSAGEYGAGNLMRFDVEFTDDVMFSSTSTFYPLLNLNIGGWDKKNASFEGGFGSKVLTFLYSVVAGDDIASLMPMDLSVSKSPVYCTARVNCALLNRNDVPVDLSAVAITDALIKIDTTAPFITKVWTFKNTSSYDRIYTVGETIDIYVRWNKPILVTGKMPRLLMNVGVPERYAEWNYALSNIQAQNTFVLTYKVNAGDMAKNLTYIGPTIDRMFGLSTIYRVAGTPTTQALYTLPNSLAPKPISDEAISMQYVIIDTQVNSFITEVVFVTPPGDYVQGDVIVFKVMFSLSVILTGRAYIHMNMGKHIRFATYIGDDVSTYSTTVLPPLPSNPSKSFFFKIVVQAGDFNSRLDYTDSFSFFIGVNDVGGAGYLRQASTTPTKKAILDMPRPGSSGSLSDPLYSVGGAYVSANGHAPRMTNIAFTTSDGIYASGDVITIAMDFSIPVIVTGIPSIKLNVQIESVNREAYYVSGSGSTRLIFVYEILAGDYVNILDYESDRNLFNSAHASFKYNGATIKAASMNPTTDAIVYLNPPGGELTGTTNLVATAGVFPFLDLSIKKRGNDYMLQFVSSPAAAMQSLVTTQTVFVSFSNEYELSPMASQKFDLVGYDVDIQNNFAVVGAPATNISVNTIQTVTTIAQDPFLKPLYGVQIVGTAVSKQPLILSFHTTGDVGSIVAGTFKVYQPDHTGGLSTGISRSMPVNVQTGGIVAVLTEDFPHLGRITANREAYIFCACKNAFTWTVTFHDLIKGNVPSLNFVLDGLEGSSAIVGPKRIQEAGFVGGQFKLNMWGKQTEYIPYDADADTITKALHAIGAWTIDVTMVQDAENLSRERFWRVTFDHHEYAYDVPLMTSTFTNDPLTGLTGTGAYVYITEVQKGVHGPGGYNGGFHLVFRGNTTRFISFDANASTVQAALNELPVINHVEVNRSHSTSLNGYTWTVELVDVNFNTPRGYKRAVVANLEPMTVVNKMIGTNIDVKIGTHYVMSDEMRRNKHARAGTFGRNAGSVYLYEKDGEVWNEVSTLRGNDTAAADRFGSSVALDALSGGGDVVVVGAVSASMNGVYERQAIECKADSGSFTLSFRGWTSSEIPFDVNKEELEAYIDSDPNFFDDGIYSIEAIEIDEWGTGSEKNKNFCDGNNGAGNTAYITFFAPLNSVVGNDLLLEADIAVLTYTNSLSFLGNPANSVLITSEVRKGTVRAHGTTADLQQHGAAYVFRATCETALLKCAERKWIQEAQLFPIPADEDSPSDRFGHSSSVYGDVIAIGAPGGKNGRGHVYIYEYKQFPGNSKKRWELFQRILVEATVFGDEFGYALDLKDLTLAISAPYMTGTGAVMVYKRARMGDTFKLSQEIKPNMVDYPLQTGDMFGYSLAVDNLYLIIGAPGRDSPAIYFGQSPSVADTDTGAIFVFYRESLEYLFEFTQALNPSNVRRHDRFGWSVDISGSTIVASSLQSYDGVWNASRAIMEVKTEGKYNDMPIGNSFALTWKSANSTGDYVPISTRQIQHDASAPEMEYILETDLHCGDVLVSRSDRDVYNNGYSWMITFVGQTRDVPLLQADITQLTGTDARVDIGFINEYPSNVRGISHVFQRSRVSNEYHVNGDFIEEVFVGPFAYQGTDRCGSSVAVIEGYAIVGCPNRDKFIPNQNSGSASVFNLNLLNLEFDSAEYSVVEGAMLNLGVVTRDKSNGYQIPTDILFYTESVDRNAAIRRQTSLRNIFGLDENRVPMDKTAADIISNSGTAIGRGQYYGSIVNESQWVGGMYDYRGISDYVPINKAVAYLVEHANAAIPLYTTPDTLVERPNENLTVAIHSPGIWPSVLSGLYTTVNILDNGDGHPTTPTGNTCQFDKVYESDCTAGSQLGYTVSTHEISGYMATGTPFGFKVTASPFIGAPPDKLRCGVVVLYKKVGGAYVEHEKIFSPNAADGNKFGDGLILRSGYLDGTALLVVGEPNAMCAHVWLYDGVTFAYEALFTAPEITLTNHRFGSKGTIGLDRNLLVIGAPGAEAIFVYIRGYSGGSWVWSAPTIMRSSNYDYDIIFTVITPHRQEFGAAAAVSGRQFVIGSPFADYGKTGSDLVELDINTEGVDIFSYGRGKSYMFYSSPAIESFTIFAPTQLIAGSFVLEFTGYGVTTTTADILFSAPALTVQNALNLLSNLHDVSVSTNVGPVTGGFQYSWTVTFNSEFDDPAGNFNPRWNGYGCASCTPFSHSPSDPSQQILLGERTSMSAIRESQVLTASDKDAGYRFGSAVALDNDQLVIGSMWADSTVTTDWTFESGTLMGWGRTGTAFDFQPTFEDNSSLRPIYTPADETTGLKAVPESVQMRGRYYIGTFEKRPGNPNDYEVASSDYSQGGVQGDGPVGTLSSEVFMVNGDRITFLIGGGCQIRNVYVELLIDGLSVARETGRCTERMEEALFDTSLYLGRAGQIRIVDASSGKWGHINADHFQFSWDIDGRRMNTLTGKTKTTGKVETKRAGAVYAFHLTRNNSINLCSGSKFLCVWNQEARLVASDKRGQAFFGYSVAVNDKIGLIAVGAPMASKTGFYKESPIPYPFLDEVGGSTDVTTVAMPIDSQLISEFQSFPNLGSLSNGAKGIWYEEKLVGRGYQAAKGLNDYSYANAEAGAVYIYKKDFADISGSGDVNIAQLWYTTELAKLQGSEGTAMDRFGTSISLDGKYLAVGSVGNDGWQPDAGAVYMYHTGFASAYFARAEFEALEGTNAEISITVNRNPVVFAGELVLEYATSDLTATGVDKTKFDACLLLATNLRGPSKCGDYQQTMGNLVIPVGSNSAGFKVRIMNDLCHEKFLKYVQITLSVPGAGSIQGRTFSSRIRIDDDDFLEKECFWSK